MPHKGRIPHDVVIANLASVNFCVKAGEKSLVELHLLINTKNRGADFSPVEWSAVLHQNVNDFLGEAGNLNVVGGKEPTVHIGRGSQAGVVLVPILKLRVQALEQLDECVPQARQAEGLDVVLKACSSLEEPRILGVEAEHQADAEDVEGAEAASIGLNVFLDEGVVELPDQDAGLQADLLFTADLLASGVHQKWQVIKLFFQILKQDDFWLYVELMIENSLTDLLCLRHGNSLARGGSSEKGGINAQLSYMTLQCIVLPKKSNFFSFFS